MKKTIYTPTAMSDPLTVEVRQVDEYYIEILPELLERVGWKEGDNIKFNIRKNGTISLKKVETDVIELDLDDDELFKYMRLSHERGQSFNEFVEEALENMINKAEFESECG